MSRTIVFVLMCIGALINLFVRDSPLPNLTEGYVFGAAVALFAHYLWERYPK